MNELIKIKISDFDRESWPSDFSEFVAKNEGKLVSVESEMKLCSNCDYLFFENDLLKFHSSELGVMSFDFKEYKSMRSKLNILFNYKLGYENNDIDMEKLIKKRNDYMHSRKLISVNSQEIVSWFAKLLKMIEIIETPPKLKINNTDHLTKLKDKFKN
jgi:hypothetical protein